ncbi:protein of unknown function [Actinomadura madurae]|uniref:DUF4158 domain-containing protein n=2 Tax=Actinomadura madurae TaxID=1993 RepID=A0A1I5JMU9_9ACTN|nr:protein of unknown function [Actinomadura madurae]
MARYLPWRGRFPRGRSDLPDEMVEFVARQVKVSAADIAFYDFGGRTIKGDRRELREALGWRPCGVPDAEKLATSLAEDLCTKERRPEQVRVELLSRCRADKIEPPTALRIDTIVRSALHQGEQLLIARVQARSGPEARQRILALVARPGSGDGDASGEQADREEVEDEAAGVLGQIKQAPGDVSLNSMLTEISKLDLTRGLQLPDGLFAGISPKIEGVAGPGLRRVA